MHIRRLKRKMDSQSTEAKNAVNQSAPERIPGVYPEGVRPDVLNYDDLCGVLPLLRGHHKLVDWLIHWLYLDKVNEVHARWAYDPGIPFARHLVEDEFKFDLEVENEDILQRFPTGAFITVSNHPYGGMDGILLIHIVGKYRPDYQVMVNMFLNHISAMQSAFIAVDPQKTEDPAKRAVTLHGMRRALKDVSEGHPIGFFPAGAVSKFDKHLHVTDLPWQPSIIRLIKQMKVPVIPIYFHGHNSTFFSTLGLIDWRLRSMRLPRELFNMTGKKVKVTIGEPIMPDVLKKYKDLGELGKFLREQTYSLNKK